MNDKDRTFNLGVGGKPLLSFSLRRWESYSIPSLMPSLNFKYLKKINIEIKFLPSWSLSAVLIKFQLQNPIQSRKVRNTTYSNILMS
jgi:hypothetical protein